MVNLQFQCWIVFSWKVLVAGGLQWLPLGAEPCSFPMSDHRQLITGSKMGPPPASAMPGYADFASGRADLRKENAAAQQQMREMRTCERNGPPVAHGHYA